MLRPLELLRGIEDIEDAAEGVRVAGVARLCSLCADIFALQSSTQLLSSMHMKPDRWGRNSRLFHC